MKTFDNPITEDEIQAGLYVRTYALAGPGLDYSESRSPSAAMVIDWNAERGVIKVEYGPYCDVSVVPWATVKAQEPRKVMSTATRGKSTPTFP